jgi:hypothetical protein
MHHDQRRRAIPKSAEPYYGVVPLDLILCFFIDSYRSYLDLGMSFSARTVLFSSLLLAAVVSSYARNTTTTTSGSSNDLARLLSRAAGLQSFSDTLVEQQHPDLAKTVLIVSCNFAVRDVLLNWVCRERSFFIIHHHSSFIIHALIQSTLSRRRTPGGST